MGLFLIGLLALIIGARLLVFGASQLAATLKLSTLTIGLTVVAFGTSAPEIATCSWAAWNGEGGLVIGNIVGSNIFNTLFILGLLSTISPIVIQKQLIRLDVPIMIGVTILFWILVQNGILGRWEGIALFVGIILYTIFAIRLCPGPKEKAAITLPIHMQLVWIIVGLVLLALGAQWLILGATRIAQWLNIPQLFVGLTFVAVGTSLPEIAVTLIAIGKKEPEMAVGGLIGSNIFNLLAVGGIAGIIAPQGLAVPANALSFDIPVMLATAIATFPIILTGHLISRWEGLVLLFYYGLYLFYLIFQVLHPAYLPLFSTAFTLFILPLTALVLIIALVRHFKKRRE